MSAPDVLVVGGGIVGCAVAAACAKRGLRVRLLERAALASGASALELALVPRDVSAEEYLALHHFSGGAFLLDRAPPEDWPARRIDPRAAAAALADEARSYRAAVTTGCDVKALRVRGGSVGGALADEGEIAAGTTVVAAGAGTRRLCESAGLGVAVRGEPGELLVVDPPAEPIERPAVDGEAWVAPLPSGRLAVAHPGRASRIVPGLEELRVVESTPHLAPTAPGQALVGPVPELPGLVLAAGHGQLGVALAPSTGEAVANGIVEGAWDG